MQYTQVLWVSGKQCWVSLRTAAHCRSVIKENTTRQNKVLLLWRTILNHTRYEDVLFVKLNIG